MATQREPLTTESTYSPDEVFVTIALNRKGEIVHVAGPDGNKVVHKGNGGAEHEEERPLKLGSKKKGGDPCCVTDPITGRQYCWC